MLQGSLLDSPAGAPPPSLAWGIDHVDLGAGAWLERRPGWFPDPGLFAELESGVAWHAESRTMYDRVVEVPRLLAFFEEGEDLPHPSLEAARAALDARYAPLLGERLATVGLCRYRDGRDSVAWHGDTVGRAATEDTVVAILSLGATRRFLLRPATGGPSARFDLFHGDLLVMGGSCQRTWHHAVPKTARPIGPRISVQFRARGVR